LGQGSRLESPSGSKDPFGLPASRLPLLRLCRLGVANIRRYLDYVAESVNTAASGTSTAKQRNPILRALFFVLGFVCLALIPISYLPGIPTFDLILLAAFFFSMSSDRMHNWMLNHRYFGKIIKGYRDYGLTMRMKWIAAVSIAISLSISGVLLTDLAVIRLILVAVGVYAFWFVFSRPTRAVDVTV